MDELLKQEVVLLRSMNFAKEYIEDCYNNCKKWEVTGILRGIKDPFIARQVSELLENQRLWNEQYEQNSQWKRFSIPVIRRVFNQDFLAFNLVSVQTVRKPDDFLYFLNEDMRVRSVPSETRTRFLSLPWNGPEIKQDDCIYYNGKEYSTILDAESEATLDYSLDYAFEINKEIVNDLLLICDNKNCVYENPEQLFSLVEGMSAYIGTKTSYEATWIVAHPKVCEILRSNVGNRWNLYAFDVPQEKILLGHKNFMNNYITGYIYSPYLPFSMVEKGVLVRYNKKLVNASFYGSITLSNFFQEEFHSNEEIKE